MSVPPLTNLSDPSNLGGTTGAKKFKNTKDKYWVVKRSQKRVGKFTQTYIEFVANEIYEAIGIPVPKHALLKDAKGKDVLVLEYIDGKLLSKATAEEYEKAKEELKKGFIIDALLANWDVIGLERDNILLPADGSPAVRIDNGGTLIFRAQGGKRNLTEDVTEINSMRESSQGAPIFGDLTDDTIADQIYELIEPNYDMILSKLPEELHPIIKARMDYLLNWAYGEDEGAEAKPEYIPAVQAAIVDFFRDGWLKNFPDESAAPKDESDKSDKSDKRLLDFINTVLQENEAVISGGFILKAIGSFVDKRSIDIDIYVPSNYAKTFVPIMHKLFNSEKATKLLPSANPKSASRAAGINAVVEASKTVPAHAEMDIVYVNTNDDRVPSNVIKKFDLTFCENWYDGKTVYMVHPVHVEKKAGYVTEHYLDKLYSENSKLLGRLKKYMNRGFKIYIDNPNTNTIENLTPIINSTTIFKTHKGTTHTETSRRNTKKTGKSIFSIPLTNIKNTIHVGDDTKPVTNINWINSTVNTNTINFNAITSETPTQFYKNVIEFYTGVGSSIINDFLKDDITDKIIITSDSGRLYSIYKTILRKFAKYPGEHPIGYSNRLNYYYYINLCNAIYSIRPNLEIPIIVYRGTKTWYLNQKKDIFHYTNTFCSTSIDIDIANNFGSSGVFGHTNLYEFYLHPRCIYANIAHISKSSDEAEIVITPYHRYMYIREYINGRTTTKTFVILPSDLTIPDDPYEFMEWKEDILTRTSVVNGAAAANGNGAAAAAGNGAAAAAGNGAAAANGNGAAAAAGNTTAGGGAVFVGGRELAVINSNIHHANQLFVKQLPINKQKQVSSRQTGRTKKLPKNSRKILKQLLSRISTMKKSKVPKPSKEDETTARFTDPIPSFPGKAPTAAEKEVIQKMVAFFERK